MNQVITAVLERRSIRNYLDKIVEKEKLELLAKCATFAPSGMNSQPWHFSVISKKETLKKISAINKIAAQNSGVPMLQKMSSDDNFDCFRGASSAILISYTGDSDSACGYAAENIALAAYSLGLGTCIVGSVKIGYEFGMGEKLDEIISLPDGYKLGLAIAIGYPNGDMPKAPARKNGLVSYLD